MSETSTERQFWDWFGSIQHLYRSMEAAADSERLMNEFEKQLHAIDEDLYFEFSEPMEDGGNELVITACGKQDKFDCVRTLVAAAPALAGWTIIAFKPAMGFTFTHDHGDVVLKPSELWFLPLVSKSNPRILGLRIAVPDYDPTMKDKITHSLWIVLDTGLGEVVCAERIKHLEVTTMPVKPADECFIELNELPDYLAWIDRREATAQSQ